MLCCKIPRAKLHVYLVIMSLTKKFMFLILEEKNVNLSFVYT